MTGFLRSIELKRKAWTGVKVERGEVVGSHVQLGELGLQRGNFRVKTVLSSYAVAYGRRKLKGNVWKEGGYLGWDQSPVRGNLPAL